MPGKATKGRKPAKEKLTPIPAYKPGKKRTGEGGGTSEDRTGGTGLSASPVAASSSSPPQPDLSHITPDLRPLAVPCADLAFLPVNPRLHAEKDLAGIRASLREFGQMKPVVVNSAKQPPEVVAGNGTLQAALSLGWTMIGRVVEPMSDAKAAAFAVADNRVAELSTWDKEALDSVMREMQTGDEDLAAMFKGLAEAQGLIPKEQGEVKPGAAGSPAESAKAVCPECGHEFKLPE